MNKIHQKYVKIFSSAKCMYTFVFMLRNENEEYLITTREDFMFHGSKNMHV